MRTKHLILITAILFSAVCGAMAQKVSPKNPTQSSQKSPEQVIKEIYTIHAQDLKSNADDRILNDKNRRYLDKYFDKNLADLIWKDLTTNRDEVGVIDFDLFYAGQDEPKITNFRVVTTQKTDKKATVNASFNNWNTKTTIVYELAQTNGGWKIADIKYGKDDSLLKYFKDAEKNQ